MGNLGDHIVGYGIWTVVAIGIVILLRMANIIRYIPNNQVGIVEKLWAAQGSIKSGFIALQGEAGFQPEILRGGIHFFFPFSYRIQKSDLVTVGQGKIAYVFARDGAPLAPSQVLAANDVPEKAEFQDVRQFLMSGGQKGPQRKILREGTYAINTTQFAIITDERVFGHALSAQEQRVLDGMKQTLIDRDGFGPIVIAAADDNIGIVTVHDGPSLQPGRSSRPRSVRISPTRRRFTTISRSRKSSCEPAAIAVVSFRCWSKAPGTSTGCSPRSNGRPRPSFRSAMSES